MMLMWIACVSACHRIRANGRSYGDDDHDDDDAQKKKGDEVEDEE